MARDAARETIELVGDIPSGLAGERVRVSGKRAGGFGFTMVGGSAVEVRQVEKAS